MCFLWIEQLFLMKLKMKTFNMVVTGMHQSTKLKKRGEGQIYCTTQDTRKYGELLAKWKKKGSKVINERYDNNKIQEGLNKSILITLSKKPGASEFHTPSNNQIHEPHD